MRTLEEIESSVLRFRGQADSKLLVQAVCMGLMAFSWEMYHHDPQYMAIYKLPVRQWTASGLKTLRRDHDTCLRNLTILVERGYRPRAKLLRAIQQLGVFRTTIEFHEKFRFVYGMQ